MEKAVQKTFRVKKLVRDCLPERVERDYGSLQSRRLDDVEFAHELRRKLHEEIDEAFAAQDHTELCDELSDVYEVLEEYALLHGLTLPQIEEKRMAKRAERGGLARRLYIESVTVPSDSRLGRYYQNEPERYPEVVQPE